MVLGGESLWNKVRELVAKAQRDEEIRWRRRADAEEAARAIELLIEQEGDRRVAIWLRVRVGGKRMPTVAAEYGYRDGSGADRVIKRLEEVRLQAPDREHPAELTYQVAVLPLRAERLAAAGGR